MRTKVSWPGTKAAGKRSITAEVKVYGKCNASHLYASMVYSGKILPFRYASMYYMNIQFNDSGRFGCYAEYCG
jgi:hypothetical protein